MTAKIKLNTASGGGSFSLQAPSSSSNNRVITLPDSADGTLITTTNRGQNVLQVVRNTTIATASTDQTSYADIPNCTLNITPSSSSNKYLATFSAYITTVLATGHNQQTRIQMFRDSTQIGGTHVYAAESSSGGLQWKGSANIRDFGTFSGTSQVTFKMQMAANNTNSTVYIYNPTIIVMEFAA